MSNPYDWFRRARRSFSETTGWWFTSSLIIIWLGWRSQRIGSAVFETGYWLGGLFLFLVAYSVRKKLPGIPLGAASTWTRIHIIAAITSLPIFFVHTGCRLPTGYFETILYVVFGVTMLSGFYGLWLIQTAPRQLAALPHELIYEEIPRYRQRIVEQARAIVVASAAETDVLADFYLGRLSKFMEFPRNILFWIRPRSFERRYWERELLELDRFLSESQRHWRRELGHLVSQRDEVDFHEVMQGRLKSWQRSHVALAFGLAILVAAHVVIVHMFTGGHP